MFFSTGKHHLAHHLLAIDDIDTWTKEAEISTEIASVDAIDAVVYRSFCHSHASDITCLSTCRHLVEEETTFVYRHSHFDII